MAGIDIDREGGAFFANTRKTSQNMPDYRGELRISAETLANLNEQANSGVQNPIIQISGWKKTSNSGTVFISMSGKKPYVKDGQQQGGSPSYPIRPQHQAQNAAPNGGWSNSMNNFDDDIPF